MTHTICQIITKLELGGAQQTTLFIVAHLARSRFRPVLISGEPGLLDDEAKALGGVEFYQVPSLVRQIRPWRDLRALAELTRLLKTLKPAIVHTHSSKAGILGRWAAWLAGVPIIIHTIHGSGISPSQPAWLRWLLIGLERLTGLITTHWITVSEADVVKGLGWGLFQRSNVSVIRPGITTRAFQFPRLPEPDHDRLRAEWASDVSICWWAPWRPSSHRRRRRTSWPWRPACAHRCLPPVSSGWGTASCAPPSRPRSGGSASKTASGWPAGAGTFPG